MSESKPKLKVLDLFSGILVGGFSLGLERTGGFETVAFCEIEPFPRRVLAKHWPEIYCHDDVRTLNKETLCRGYAENALLNRLCRETGGRLAFVKPVIASIKESADWRSLTSTTNGPQSAEKASLTTMAGNVPAVESANMRSWQSIISTITAMKNAQNTSAQLGKSLSSAECQTIIRFFATTATQQNPSTVPALIKAMAGVYDNDVRTLTADVLRRDGIAVDVITGGFPCQDLSVAGKQRGMGEGTRSGLWSEIVRLIGEIRPQYVIVENVAALLSGPSERRGGWFGRVLGDLAECGYDAEWENIPAAALGAPHRRERVWVCAYPAQDRDKEQHIALGGTGTAAPQGAGKPHQLHSMAGSRQAHVPHANRYDGKGKQPRGANAEGWAGQITGSPGPLPAILGRQWETEPDVGRVAHGVSDRAHRLAALGNAVVPQIPELIGRAILEARA